MRHRLPQWARQWEAVESKQPRGTVGPDTPAIQIPITTYSSSGPPPPPPPPPATPPPPPPPPRAATQGQSTTSARAEPRPLHLCPQVGTPVPTRQLLLELSTTVAKLHDPETMAALRRALDELTQSQQTGTHPSPSPTPRLPRPDPCRVPHPSPLQECSSPRPNPSSWCGLPSVDL